LRIFYCFILTAFLSPLNVNSSENIDTISYSQTEDTILLNEVTVEAFHIRDRLTNIPGSTSVLSGDELSMKDATNLAQVLNTLPGLHMQSGTYTTNRITIRGMGSRTPYNTNRIRAYINEIPVTAPDGISTPEEIDLQNIGRLEVIKGPASALFGSGLGGSINLYTPVIASDKLESVLQYRSFNTFKGALSGSVESEKTILWGSVGHLQSEGYRENSRYRRTSIMLNAERKYRKWSLSALLLMMDLKSGLPSSLGKTLFENSPKAAAPSWKAVGGYKRNFKGLTGITFKYSLTENLNNSLSVYGRFYDGFERRPFNDLDDRAANGGIRNKLMLHTGWSDWILGMEWTLGRYLWQFNNDQGLLNRNRENQNHINIFAMAYFRPVAALNISLALAANHVVFTLTDLYAENGDQTGRRKFPLIISPRAGFNYSIGKRWNVYASAGHGFSLPSPEETLLPEGDINPDIRHEQGIQYELGVRFRHEFIATNIDMVLYRIDLSNLILTKRISEDIFTGINAGKTRHQGIEFSMKNRWFSFDHFPGLLFTDISFAQSVNRFIEFTDDSSIYNGNRLPGIPEQTANLQLVWNAVDIITLESGAGYTGVQFLNDDNSLKSKSFFLIDLKISLHIKLKKSGFILYAGINNVTDAHYASMVIVNAQATEGDEPRYFYPGLPRNGYLGLRFSL